MTLPQTAEQIQAVVARVLEEVSNGHKPPHDGTGIFADIASAVAAARRAFHAFCALPLERREEIIRHMRRVGREHAQLLAYEAWQETGLGRYEDKIEKNLLNLDKTPGTEDIKPIAYTGDHGLTLVERAPYGVIASITPSTNPTATIFCNAIAMVAGGNAVTFNVHPMAKRVSAHTVAILNRAILQAGGPPNLLTCIAEPTIESAQALMRHPDVNLVVVTGGGEVVREAMTCGKKAICAGPGNPPVVVDETAILEQAARDIIKGASFDNNIVCTDEKEIFVVEPVADRLKALMKARGVVELTAEQTDRLLNAVLLENRGSGRQSVVNKKFVGKDAAALLAEIGVEAGHDLRLLMAEVDDPRHPLVWTEMLMPILPLVRVPDVHTAIELALEAEHGFLHTAVMHSKNLDNLSRMARAFQGSIFVKNGPSLAGVGYTGEGYCSFTIASPTGEGLTSAKDFTRVRRCVLKDSFRIV
ncbi:MAG: aldehyde dehydrogenase EutE [Caldilineae bacterium]|nr:MAG: aldehyde dehydrogenase EutE [Caldilineae bacterium]